MILCYLAAVAAGSTDGKDMAANAPRHQRAPGNQYTWEQLPEAIKALQDGEDIDYIGASGAIDIDENGDPTAGVYDIYSSRTARSTRSASRFRCRRSRRSTGQ